MTSLQQLVKSFGDQIATPVAEALGEFMAQIPALYAANATSGLYI